MEYDVDLQQLAAESGIVMRLQYDYDFKAVPGIRVRGTAWNMLVDLAYISDHQATYTDPSRIPEIVTTGLVADLFVIHPPIETDRFSWDPKHVDGLRVARLAGLTKQLHEGLFACDTHSERVAYLRQQAGKRATLNMITLWDEITDCYLPEA